MPRTGPTSVDVRVVNPADDGALRGWWEVRHAVELERPVDLTWPWDVDRVALLNPKVGRDETLVGGYLDGRLVGAAMLIEPTDHNQHLAIIDVRVAAAARRRGVGTALIDDLSSRARQHGRTTMLADVRVPLDAPTSPGRQLAEFHGFALANEDVSKVVELARTAHLWPALEAHALERRGEHRLTWFRGGCPDELAEGVCGMFSRFLGEIPLGEVDLRPQAWTVARLRQVEAVRDRNDGDYLMVLALDADGVPVGYTDVEVRRRAPRVGFIHSTLVLPDARGHRLGLAMKVRLHQLARDQLAGIELIETGNAASNTHMNAVNEALGYRPVDRVLEMQRLI